MSCHRKGGAAANALIAVVIAMCCALSGCGKSSYGANDTVDTTSARGGIEWYPSMQLGRLADALARAGSSGRTFGGGSSFHYVESRRDRSGSPEIHDQWVDLTIVQSGRATIISGGRVNGGTLATGGEHRGGTIVGGVTQRVAAGDFFVVPAGVPHQFQVARGDSIRYLTIKVAR